MKWFLPILFLLLPFSAFAQYPPPTGGFDTYHGLAGTNCTHGTATAFSLDTITVSAHQNIVFCDFSSHVYYLKGFFTFDNSQPGGSDEFGHTYNFYTTAKYGTQQNWADASIGRFLSWGYTGLAPGRATSVTNPWATANPVPFIAGADVSHYSVSNPQGYTHAGCDLPKDLSTSLKTTSFSGATSFNLVDYNSSCWGTYVRAYMDNDNAFAVRSQTTAFKHYLVAIALTDADNSHCLGAGPDFVPANGNYDFRCGTMSLYAPPTQFADSGNGQVYTDGTVAIKKSIHTIAISAHTNFTGINTSWGSSYTTDLTSGTCFGSLQPTYVCPSPAAAFALGTGNGVQTVFTGTLNTIVSKFSIYVAANGAIIGGDTGSGGIFGNKVPAITLASSTINYSTGALSITFTTAPANGVVLTVGYIQNGWGIGTGLLDEDCRAGHASYCGSSLVFLTGMTTGLKTDIGATTKQYATDYAGQATTAISGWASTNSFTGKVLFAGVYALGSWGAPPDSFVLQGMAAGGQDVIIASGSGNGFSHWTQGMLDYVHTNWGDVPIIESSYRVSNRDSSFAWPGSPATSTPGTTAVSATLTTPINFSTGSLIDSFCADASYNRLQAHPNSVNTGTGVVTYTSTSNTVSASTTCTVQWSDNNEGGFSSQITRGNDYKSDIGAAPTVAYTTGGKRMYVGLLQWAWQDYHNEKLNWGDVTVKDNPYNGIDGNSGSFACQAPDGAHTCGGEATDHLNGGPLGDFIDLVGQAHGQIDTYFLGGGGGSSGVTLSITSASFGTEIIGLTDNTCNVSLSPCIVQLTNSGTATLNISSIALSSGVNFGKSTTCGATLGVGLSCNVTLTFTPTTLGALSDTLTFTTDAPSSPDTVSLTGNGVPPPLPAIQFVKLTNRPEQPTHEYIF